MTRFAPGDLGELRDAIGEALALAEPLELVAGGSKRGLGRPLQTPHTLDLSRLAGIRDYEPTELVLTAAAATPLAEVEAALAAAGQMLGFEPPDWSALLGVPAAEAPRQTLGGVLACNLSGPRRLRTGAARDHFLGFRGVSGRGEIFKAGGKVVKNVTGYDLAKLMAGSYGTLAALEEVTVKVLPRPETECTVSFGPVAPGAAARVMAAVLGAPHEVSAAAYRAGMFATGQAFGARDDASVMFRLEGHAPSVAYRRERLLADRPAGSVAEMFAGDDSGRLWRWIRDVGPLAGRAAAAIWRVSVAPSRGAEIGEALAREADAGWYLDWGGGLLWLAVDGREDGGAALIRRRIRGADGRGSGHATLIRGSAALRRAVAVFEPQPAPLAALSARVKAGFDPRNILNPGRMAAGG